MNADSSRHKKADDAGDFVRPAVAIQRAGFDQAVLVDLVNPQEPLGDGPARRDAIDRDVVRPQLVGQAARVFVDGGFGHGIDRPVGRPCSPAMLPMVMIRPDFRCHHFRGDFAAAEHGRRQIAVQHAAQIVQRDVQAIVVLRPSAAADAGPRSADVSAGAAHEQVDPPGTLADFRGDAGRLRLPASRRPTPATLRRRCSRRSRRQAAASSSFAESRRAVRPRAMHGDLGPQPAQFLGDHAADPRDDPVTHAIFPASGAAVDMAKLLLLGMVLTFSRDSEALRRGAAATSAGGRGPRFLQLVTTGASARRLMKTPSRDYC